MSSSAGAAIKFVGVFVGLTAVGIGLMKAVVPTPEQTYAAMAPDLRKKVDANRAARLAMEQEYRQQHNIKSVDPDNAQPVWANKL
ncbi:hypothetical protein PENSPDRAFT_759048 [Peniophora sp. CONT]|nr:hypothetical protein PENSPDRAFT_759048 [Peniophora sp. CONT]